MKCPLSILLGLLVSCSAFAQTPPPLPADAWITNTVQFPAGIDTNAIRTYVFADLHIEVVAKRVKIIWPSAATPESTQVTLLASADDLGHWPARDWRSYPMTKRGINWEAQPPVDSLDVPLIYFVRSGNAADASVSPMRICRPRAANLEEPTRVFWPFLEGFEEQLESWQLLAEHPEFPLKKGTPAKNGKAALSITIPADKHSSTVATTRVRGWLIQEKNATGLRLWLRAKTGSGRARFTLLANARSPNQVVAPFPRDFPLGVEWQKIDLPFNEFPKLLLDDVDLFTIEFIGDGPREFLVDDLQLLGRWKMLVE